MSQRVIVDENAGPNSPAWEQYQRLVGDRSVEYVFLKDSHSGIPDVEILEKLLSIETILLTGDRVLHMHALARGFRSYALDDAGSLTNREIGRAHV